MATVDYHQIAEDHQSFLVLIRHAGKQLSWKQFSRCWERVCHNTCVAVPGQKRDMWIRYRRSYSRDNNEWGDIQAHRKVLGLICIGKCTNENEFEELFQSYKHEKSQYSETLFNSRLFVYGMNKDGTPLTEEQILQFDGAAGDQGQTPLTMKIDGNISDNKACDSLSNVNKENDKNVNGETKASHSDPLRSGDTSSTQVTKSTENKTKRTSNEPSVTIFKTETKPPPPPPVRTNSKPSQMNKDTPGSEVVFFPRVDNFEDELDDSVREFVTSLFFVLEGKRLDRSFERADKQLLLCAPFEKKDYVGIDPDSKSYRKKCQGRLRKHLADLCLLAGLPGEAILHYTTAIDILKPVNDWLWMGACYEGLCSAAVINVGGPGHSNSSLRRNQSFSVKRGISAQDKPLDKQRAGSIMQHHHGSYANGLQELPEMSKKTLNTDDMVEKYKEAIGLYSKYKNAGIIEMEASFKAARILIQHKKNLQASEFLQNIVYINLQLSDEDRINRYGSLSSLYAEIGFQRKASFFRRVAAMQCVAPQNPKPNWHLCHQLLVQALQGYRIYLDPKESTVKSDCINGWPVIQTRVLHELIYSARRMGNIPIAVRYTSLLLHRLLDQLSAAEKREVVSSLETLTSQTEGSTQPLALESGVIVPHIPLLNVPLVKSFKLIPLHPHLEPRQMNTVDTSSDNVFIFTPMNLNTTTDIDKTEMVKTKMPRKKNWRKAEVMKSKRSMADDSLCVSGISDDGPSSPLEVASVFIEGVSGIVPDGGLAHPMSPSGVTSVSLKTEIEHELEHGVEIEHELEHGVEIEHELELEHGLEIEHEFEHEIEHKHEIEHEHEIEQPKIEQPEIEQPEIEHEFRIELENYHKIELGNVLLGDELLADELLGDELLGDELLGDVIESVPETVLGNVIEIVLDETHNTVLKSVPEYISLDPKLVDRSTLPQRKKYDFSARRHCQKNTLIDNVRTDQLKLSHPFNANYIMLGSFHQGDLMFSHFSRGNQCVANSLCCLIRDGSEYTQNELDEILKEGDCLYKMIVSSRNDSTKLCSKLVSFDEIPSIVTISRSKFNLYKYEIISGVAIQTDPSSPLPTLQEALQIAFQKSKNLLVMIGAICSAVFLAKNMYCFFDSHSHGSNGLGAPDGRSILLTFKNLHDLVTFMYALYESMSLDLGNQFEILPVTFSCYSQISDPLVEITVLNKSQCKYQDRTDIEADRTYFEQDRTYVKQDRKSNEHDRPNMEPDRRNIEQDRTNIEQDRTKIEQYRTKNEQYRANIEQERSNTEQERSNFIQRRTTNDQNEASNIFNETNTDRSQIDDDHNKTNNDQNRANTETKNNRNGINNEQNEQNFGESGTRNDQSVKNRNKSVTINDRSETNNDQSDTNCIFQDNSACRSTGNWLRFYKIPKQNLTKNLEYPVSEEEKLLRKKEMKRTIERERIALKRSLLTEDEKMRNREKDKVLKQKLRGIAHIKEASNARESKLKRIKRQNPENRAKHNERESSAQRRKREDPEVRQKKNERETPAKRKMREDPMVRAKHNERESSAQRKIREDPEVRQKKNERETPAKRKIREDPVVRAKHNERESSAQRKKREDPEVRQKKNERETPAKRKIREDPEVRQKKNERETPAKRKLREDPEVRQKKNERETPAKRKLREDPEVRQKRNERETPAKRKKHEPSSNVDVAIHAFQESIQHGPTFICTICNRLLYRNSVKYFNKLEHESMQFCITNTTSNDGVEYICFSCEKYMKAHKLPPLAVKNGLELEEVPYEINQLNSLESIFISRRIPFMKLLALPRGKQRAIHGCVVNVPIEPEQLASVLPRLPSSDSFITVKVKRKLKYRGHSYMSTIRPRKIINALNILKNQLHNPHYKDVLLNENWIEDSEELNPDLWDSLVQTDQSDGNKDDEQLSGEESEDTDDEKEDERSKLSGINFDSCIQPKDLLHDGILSMAPGEGKKPISFMHDKFAEEMSFPQLLPSGKFGFSHERSSKLSLKKYFQCRLLNCDRRFAGNIDYIFFAQYRVEAKEVYDSISMSLRKGKEQKLTAGDLKNKVTDFARTDLGIHFMQKIRGSPAFYNKMFYDLLGMIRQLGPCTLFVTLSAADLKWTDTISIIAKQRGYVLSKEDIETLSWEEKCHFLRSDPVTAARHFNNRVNLFFKHILLNKNLNPLGEIIDYKYRIEFQQRGSPHLHMLVWIKNAPSLETHDEADIVEYINSTISCELPENDAELLDLVQTVQKHTHSVACRKHGKSCRFDFPRPPSNKTLVLKPLEEMPTTAMQNAYSEALTAVYEQLTEVDEATTLDDILQKARVSETLYTKALHWIKTKSGQPAVVLKRNPISVNINNYNPTLIKAWEANLDVQFVTNVYSCIMYLASYISKPEKTLGDVLQSVCKSSQNLGAKQAMRNVANKFLTHREVSAQEAVYRLMSLPLTQSSREIIFLCTDMPEDRTRLFKPMDILQSMDDEDEDVYLKNILDRYMARPNQLEDICLAEFAAKYRTSYNQAKPIDTSEEVTSEHTSEKITLKDGYGFMIKRHSPAIIRTHQWSIKKDPEKYFHSQLLLYCPWRNEINDLLVETYQNSYHLNLAIINGNRQHYEHKANEVADVLEQIDEFGFNEDNWITVAPQTEQARLEDSNEGVEYEPSVLDAYDTSAHNTDFHWVEGESCEIQLQVYNPMPDELKVTHMGLLSEGVELETFPASPSIAAESGPYPVKIVSKPTSAGTLKVLGYSSKVYGVKSNCRLKDCPSIPQPYFTIKVVPALPQIQISSSLSKSASFLSFGEEFNVVTSATTVLYTGQSCECVVTVQNTGKLPVEMIKASLECSRENKDIIGEVFQWNKDNIESQLPLHVSSLLCFSLALSGIGDCLPLMKVGLQKSSESLNRHISKDGKSVEALLKLEYSGGPGLVDNYCRCCSIAFVIDVQPSIVFHKWEVMASESADHCYLVFDLQNLSGQDLEVHYGSSQIVYLHNDQIRRITIQIERCQPIKASDNINSFSQYLATFVDIRWKIPSLDVHGKASIEHLDWTQEQQQLVFVSPVSWDIHLNGHLYSPLHIGSLDYKVGDTVEIKAEVNIANETLAGPCMLCICCVQDCDNGSIDQNTSQTVIPLGAECKYFSQISIETPIIHSCTYMFACTGTYKFELSLKIKQLHVQQTDQPTSQDQISDVKLNDNVSITTGEHDPVTLPMTLKVEEKGDLDLETWKCSSVIEVTVSS